MGKIHSRITFGKTNRPHNFKKDADKGVQKSAFNGNSAAKVIFNKYDKDHNNILDAKELADMNDDIQKAASAHNSKNMGKREAANFLGADYTGENAQKDISEFLNTIGTSADTVESAYTENGITTVTYNPKNNEQLTEIYRLNADGNSILNSQTTVNSEDNTKTTVTYDETGENPVSKTIKKGAVTIEVDPATNRPIRQITEKGNGVKEIIEYTYDDEKGTVTETTTNQDGTVLSTKVKDTEGNEIEPNKEAIETPQTSETSKTPETPDTQGIQTGGGSNDTQNVDEKNTKTAIVQNGESLAAIAKKFGCSVEELKELNKDQLKGKGNNQYFDVGAEIKLPDSVSDEQYAKASEGRKPAEMAKMEYEHAAQIRKQKAEAEQKEKAYYQKRLGVKSFNNKGKKVKAEGWGNKEFEIVGQLGYGRQLVKRGNQLYTMSHDNKILREDYLQAHKAYVSKPKEQRNNTASGIDGVTYVKDNNGKVWYFDEKTGKAIIKNDYKQIVKKESAYVANQLHTAATKGIGTDNELMEKGVRNIYSSDILNGVNAELRTKDSDYDVDVEKTQMMPVEALILDENNHKSARPLFKILVNSGAMSVEEQARTVKREMEYELAGDGNIKRAFTHFEFGTGYTSTEDLNDIMSMVTSPDVRNEIEKQYRNDPNFAGLEPDDGSYVRARIKKDGGSLHWNDQEVDQFDANWIKSGAYSEAKLIQAKDQYGQPVFDEYGNPVYEVDENGEDKVDWGDQVHRNAVIQRLVFKYGNKEALNKGLEACNDDVCSSDYRSLYNEAEKYISNDTTGKYKERFKSQDSIQRYIAGFHSDSAGNVDAGNVSASNTCLFKGIKPTRILAEEALYKAQQGDYSQTFDSMEPETYSTMSELVANGDVKGVKSMRELYDKAYNSTTNKDEQIKIKANAILSGQFKGQKGFTDNDIKDFCIELMHNIDSNEGFANSENTVGTSGGSISNGLKGALNTADYQTEQLKAILQANPGILADVKKSVEQGSFEVVINKTVALNTDTYTNDTKSKYLDLINDTKIISEDAVFLDENGNKITDKNQIQALTNANMRSLNEMRKYVAELEREYKKGIDSEGILSKAANSLSEASGFGTDRDDVANEYRQAKLMLNQFEAAAQGRLRDNKGNVISAQDLAKQMSDKQNSLTQTNSNYKQTIAYGKMGIVMAPVIAATAGAGVTVAALGGGTMAAAVGSGVAAGATTYGVNAYEYKTSYTGDTAEARERNLQDSAIAAGTTAIGVGQMKYIGNMANNMGTVARTTVRLATTVAADTLVGAGAEAAVSGEVTASGLATNMLSSAVSNGIGAMSTGRKGATHGHIDNNVPSAKSEQVNSSIRQEHVETDRHAGYMKKQQQASDKLAVDMSETPISQAELEAYAKKYGYEALTPEQRATLDAYHAQNNEVYSQAHRIENNAKITHEKAVKVETSNAEITALENEIKGLDGQIKKLNQQIFGAKKMGKNTAELEKQLANLQAKRTAKAQELETAKKPVEAEPSSKSEKAEEVYVEEVDEIEAKRASEAPHDIKSAQEITPAEPVNETPTSAKAKNTTEAKEQLDKTMAENGFVQNGMIMGQHSEYIYTNKATGEQLTIRMNDDGTHTVINRKAGSNPVNDKPAPTQDNRVIISGDENGGYKKSTFDNDVELREDKSSSSHFNDDVEIVEVESSHFDSDIEIAEAIPDSAPVVTSEHKMQMGKIGEGINKASTPEELAKLQRQLADMPECQMKQHLQRQLEQKANTTAQPEQFYFIDTDTNEALLLNANVQLQKGVKQKINTVESVRLADSVDINFSSLETKLKSMNNGDSFIIGRKVNGANDIKINNEHISGQHLKVEKINGEIYITDMSTNGTTLNSTKPDYAAQYSPQLKEKFVNADTRDFSRMIDDNYKNLRNANYTYEESVRGNITDADLINDRNMDIFESGSWIFRYPKGGRSVDVANVTNRISLNVAADKNLLAELDRLCTNGTYVNSKGQTVHVDMPNCTYKTPESLEGFTTRHDPITMYFEGDVSENTKNAIADIASKYARQSSNGKALMNALEGKPYIAAEAYISPQDALNIWQKAQKLNPEMANAILKDAITFKDIVNTNPDLAQTILKEGFGMDTQHINHYMQNPHSVPISVVTMINKDPAIAKTILNDLNTNMAYWNCSTGQYASWQKMVNEYRLAFPEI